ncbi:hypothetical protein J3R30DRAFT_2413419 [Lentinula aciculospora]|uniref:Uncharacterized protein n=1 Tax=Lentinula aciculospora TaxID=153920 RepID=A0A9W9AEU2_9AGAR|nr:hypothetical protein J3R30DRAFT_2413419 [Lentinula aciculospora]
MSLSDHSRCSNSRRAIHLQLLLCAIGQQTNKRKITSFLFVMVLVFMFKSGIGISKSTFAVCSVGYAHRQEHIYLKGWKHRRYDRGSYVQESAKIEQSMYVLVSWYRTQEKLEKSVCGENTTVPFQSLRPALNQGWCFGIAIRTKLCLTKGPIIFDNVRKRCKHQHNASHCPNSNECGPQWCQ